MGFCKSGFFAARSDACVSHSVVQDEDAKKQGPEGLMGSGQSGDR